MGNVYGDFWCWSLCALIVCKRAAWTFC